MGKFDKLAKFLGLAVEKYGDDAAKILEKVDSPELAVSLKGEARGDYLKAIDEVYGDQTKRMTDMGFGPDAYYHGTKQKFDQFKPSYGGSAGKGVYLTGNENIAERYKPDGGAMFKGRIRDKNILDLSVNDKIGLKNIESAAEKLGIFDEFNKLKFKGGNAFYDLLKAYENKYPKAFEGLKGIERENAFTEKIKELTGAEGFKFSQNGIENYSTMIFDPKDIRSSKAAFDPRFKDSPLLMAGGLAAPIGKQAIDMNPIEAIKTGLGYYEKAKEAVTRPLAQQLNIGKNPQDEKFINQSLKIVLDPINFIPGAAGLGAGAIQMLTPSEEEIKMRVLGKMSRGESL